MTGDKAIRFNDELPVNYQKMVNVMCDFSAEGHIECGAAFRITHQEKTAGLARAKKQIRELLAVLGGAHTGGGGLAPRLRVDLLSPAERPDRSSGEFRKRWKTACVFAGVAERNPYDLWRTAGRNLVRSGTPETVAMRISGHRTRAVFDRYNIVSEKNLREAITKTAAYVETLPVAPNAASPAPPAISTRVQ